MPAARPPRSGSDLAAGHVAAAKNREGFAPGVPDGVGSRDSQDSLGVGVPAHYQTVAVGYGDSGSKFLEQMNFFEFQTVSHAYRRGATDRRSVGASNRWWVS